MTKTMKVFFSTILCASNFLVLAGCDSKDDAVKQAEKQDAVNGVPVPSLAETKAIAQEGFILGCPS